VVADQQIVFPFDLAHDEVVHLVARDLHEIRCTMPASEITATSVVPPPMSTTMLPDGSAIGSPAPIAAAMGSS
jgi:hypothetical protein